MSKKIIVKLDNKDLPKLKSILAMREGGLADLKVTGLRYGKLGDEIVISFNIDDKHHRMIVEKFILNNLKILQPDDTTIKIIEKAQVSTSMGSRFSETTSWSKLKEKASAAAGSGADSLEESIATGNYEKVVQIAKDIKNDHHTIERAITGLTAALVNAIEYNFQKGMNNKYEIDIYLSALIKIASDEKLKNLKQFVALKSAGFKAIELCETHPENLWELVKICNNSTLVNSVNIMAAVVFARNTLPFEDEQKENLEYATKNLNIRWLQIAFDIIEFEFDSIEVEQFNALIDYVKAHR
ncbi:MAG: hypothetical protein K8H86_02025 [Ignavibacteriaceae bacterium]|nr:hypothetical protein [Ignavibacteriaceae bacterium]